MVQLPCIGLSWRNFLVAVQLGSGVAPILAIYFHQSVNLVKSLSIKKNHLQTTAHKNKDNHTNVMFSDSLSIKKKSTNLPQRNVFRLFVHLTKKKINQPPPKGVSQPPPIHPDSLICLSNSCNGVVCCTWLRFSGEPRLPFRLHHLYRLYGLY